MKNKILIGAHLSISGGIGKALNKAKLLGVNALQIFTKNASAWKEKILSENEIDDFKSSGINSGVEKIFSHDSYLINLASPESELWNRSIIALENEIRRSYALSLDGVILHPGAFCESTDQLGLDRIVQALNTITARLINEGTEIKKKFIILETTAGQGTSLGRRFEEINYILSGLKSGELFGVCIDTAHIFAAGYDISTGAGYEKTFLEFGKIIGFEKLTVFHLNDSMKDLDSRVDRHEHLGKGKIGSLFFRLLMNDERFIEIPKIIETPKGDDDEMDKMNLDYLRGLAKINFHLTTG